MAGTKDGELQPNDWSTIVGEIIIYCSIGFIIGPYTHPLIGVSGPNLKQQGMNDSEGWHVMSRSDLLIVLLQI